MGQGVGRAQHPRQHRQPRERVGVHQRAADARVVHTEIDQTGGQPVGVFYTDDVLRDHAHFSAKGVRFTREPVQEETAAYAHFIDLYGNEFVLVQLKQPA